MMLQRSVRKHSKGFTFIQLIMMIAVMIVLGAVVMPRLLSLTNQTNDAGEVAKANFTPTQSSMALYYDENQRFATVRQFSQISE